MSDAVIRAVRQTTLPDSKDLTTKRFDWRQSRLVAPVFLICLLAGWESLVRGMGIPTIVLPPPSGVAAALLSEISSISFARNFSVTLEEVIAGFAVGSLLGVVLGILIGQSSFLERTLYPYVVAFQTVPKVAIAPIIVIWFGYGLSSKIIITAMIAFFPVIANTIVGLRSAPQDQIEMLQAYTASPWQIFRMVRFPQALPFIFVGLDVAAVLAVIGAVVGEFVGAKAGLGFLILQKNLTFDMAGVFAILIVLSLIGVGLHGLIEVARRRVLFWASRTDDKPLNVP
ncbi:ABC transporter permease [Bradyrhizobium manausense]|uniref:ABC transporter permease n=1 Tax=Bradyrhizobium manausense TaxID=989370 RepID=UPI001BAD4F6F|nr:ABC transporter permease [Bradyrhizobium manausense]MBR0724187.1 ABC transporter permease [Bradyrhizobium manausense]